MSAPGRLRALDRAPFTSRAVTRAPKPAKPKLTGAHAFLLLVDFCALTVAILATLRG